MKETITKSQFIDRFKEMGREDSFSYEGKLALFEYLEQYEDDIGEEIELDIIALCCEYNEYEDLNEFWENYDKETYPNMDKIRENTQVIEIPNSKGFIIQAF